MTLQPARRKVVGPASTAAPANEMVNTAELVRGRVYFYKNREFKVGIPVVVEKETADILEDLHQEVGDADGEIMEKPYFLVRRNVPKPQTEEELRAKVPRRRLAHNA